MTNPRLLAKKVQSSLLAHADTISYGLTGLLTASLFIHVPLLHHDAYSYFLGEKKDFLIQFFWPSDLALLSLVLWTLFLEGKKPQAQLISPRFLTGKHALIILFALNCLTIILQWNNLLIPSISIYYLLLLYKGYVLHGTKTLRAEINQSAFEHVFLAGATVEATLALVQFSLQHNIGLKLLGETVLGPYMGGIAKIDALGSLFLRPYGTMPHPNILGAVLAIALIIGLYRTVAHETTPSRYYYLAGFSQISLLLTALLLTFSRAAWFSACISGLFLLWQFYRLDKVKFFILGKTYAYLGLLTLVLGLILLPLIQPRSNLFDQAYKERASYNNAGISFIQSAPLLGIGPGQSLLHMKQALGTSATPPEIQPIHNYYVLYASEFGIPALLFLVVYFTWNIYLSLKQNKKHSVLFASLFLLIACAMVFDHYFATIQPTVIVFWLISSFFS